MTMTLVWGLGFSIRTKFMGFLFILPLCCVGGGKLTGSIEGAAKNSGNISAGDDEGRDEIALPGSAFWLLWGKVF